MGYYPPISPSLRPQVITGDETGIYGYDVETKA